VRDDDRKRRNLIAIKKTAHARPDFVATATAHAVHAATDVKLFADPSDDTPPLAQQSFRLCPHRSPLLKDFHIRTRSQEWPYPDADFINAGVIWQQQVDSIYGASGHNHWAGDTCLKSRFVTQQFVSTSQAPLSALYN